MVRLVEEKLAVLARLCARRGVRRLELFGSAAAADFDPAKSDLDFLVEFFDLPWNGCADAYFGLREDLTELFQRPIDLVMISAVRNPYFLQAIQNTRTTLYAA